jgi:uracil DNA glycosylase
MLTYWWQLLVPCMTTFQSDAESHSRQGFSEATATVMQEQEQEKPIVAVTQTVSLQTVLIKCIALCHEQTYLTCLIREQGLPFANASHRI